jgi:hypothetical protein
LSLSTTLKEIFSGNTVEVTEMRKNSNGSVSMVITIMERMFSDESMFKAALREAVKETVQSIASVIINERRAEIEAACNFGELRDVLAAELARQFMASRLTDQPTPFDAHKVSPAGRKVIP